MSDTDSPSKPFKQSENDETTQTLTTDHVLPATGNDASGNSYCEDSLDDKNTTYGFDKEKDEAPGKTSSPSPGPASDTASPKKLNPTAATFIFQSKDGSKGSRPARSSLGNSSPRGGHRQGADGFVPRNTSFTGRGGARTPSSARPRGQTPVSSPSTPVSESTAATIGEGSAGANEDEGKQARGANANVPVNREPRGYVPPPPTKREKLSEAELEEKMARMRLVNAETLKRSEAQARDAEVYAAQAAKADQAAIEREQERRRKAQEESSRRIKEQGRVDDEREKARKLKLARLKAMGGGGDEGGERGEEPTNSRDSGWGEQQDQQQQRGNYGGYGGRGGSARRDEDRSSWSDRRDRGGRAGDDREGNSRGGQGQAGRGRRGARNDAASTRQSTSNRKAETPEVEVMSKPVEPVGTLDDVEKAVAASWADYANDDK